MVFLETGSTDCFFNMAFEEYVFEQFDWRESYFSLWQNENAVVVGRHQNTVAEINRNFVCEHDIQVVRRLSGGGAVYHDSGNLNFTFITDARNTDNAHDFVYFIKPVLRALTDIGVFAVMSGRNDLTIDGRKFSGNAQYTRHGRVLHHGTLLFNTNLQFLEAALTPSTLKLQSKGVSSIKSRVTNISEHTDATMGDFRRLLLNSLFPSGVMKRDLTRDAIGEINELRDRKYAAWEWNYSQSPPYTMKTEKQFAFGFVELLLDIKNGTIKNVRIFGDFFSQTDISPLESALIGARPTFNGILDTLADRSITADTFIIGMHNEDLAGML
ncbi:MAG: lipoate--protein ligase [Clostridiales bacterium]|nr:lipoate--protein ligase [Clostridiales bacterium]